MTESGLVVLRSEETAEFWEARIRPHLGRAGPSGSPPPTIEPKTVRPWERGRRMGPRQDPLPL